MNNDQREVYLEPRVAKLEVGLDRLTDDVRNLAGVVREQGSQMEQEIQKLVVAVTQAAGPKKTDWQTIIAGLALIMAIGSAVFWPLSQTVQESKQSITSLADKFESHARVANHPVGEALINRLEWQLKEHEVDGNKHHDELQKEFSAKIDDISKYYDQRLTALTQKIDLHNERLYNRVVELEKRNLLDDERTRNELDMWRHKAMGLLPQPPSTPLEGVQPSQAYK